MYVFLSCISVLFHATDFNTKKKSYQQHSNVTTYKWNSTIKYLLQRENVCNILIVAEWRERKKERMKKKCYLSSNTRTANHAGCRH